MNDNRRRNFGYVLFVLMIHLCLFTACNNPENADKKIDIDSLKGQLPTAPITPPDTARQFDTTDTGSKQ